jgi:hypothetical protein
MLGKGEIPVIVFGVLSPCSLFLEQLVHCRSVYTLNTETTPALFNGQRTNGSIWLVVAAMLRRFTIFSASRRGR